VIPARPSLDSGVSPLQATLEASMLPANRRSRRLPRGRTGVSTSLSERATLLPIAEVAVEGVDVVRGECDRAVDCVRMMKRGIALVWHRHGW
jgi:hypothetical protein